MNRSVARPAGRRIAAARPGAGEAAECAGGSNEARPAGAPSDSVSDPEELARAVCLRQLSAGPRTRAQLEQALRRREVPPAASASVLDRMVEVGLVDDAAFARAWVESRHRGRGLARDALSRELRARGVADDLAMEAVDALDGAREEEMARALLARRLPATAGLGWEVRARRLLGLLARKGYPPGLAQRLVREALREEGGSGRAADEPVT